MKREDVKNKIPGITDEQLNWIMQENGADINREKSAATALQTQLDNANAQLKTAQDGLKAFDGVDVAGLQEQVTKLKADMKAQAEGFAFDNALNERTHLQRTHHLRRHHCPHRLPAAGPDQSGAERLRQARAAHREPDRGAAGHHRYHHRCRAGRVVEEQQLHPRSPSGRPDLRQAEGAGKVSRPAKTAIHSTSPGEPDGSSGLFLCL